MRYAALLLMALMPMIAAGAEPGIALDSVATQRNVLVPFTELRMNALLDEPLELNGALLYESDGSLSKQISDPVREVISITSRAVRIERDGEIRELPLRKARGLAEFYTGLRSLLDGNYSEIREQFEISDIETGAQWSVRLVPRSAHLRKFADQLVVSGVGDVLAEIQILRSANDWQILRLDPGQG